TEQLRPHSSRQQRRFRRARTTGLRTGLELANDRFPSIAISAPPRIAAQLLQRDLCRLDPIGARGRRETERESESETAHAGTLSRTSVPSTFRSGSFPSQISQGEEAAREALRFFPAPPARALAQHRPAQDQRHSEEDERAHCSTTASTSRSSCPCTASIGTRFSSGLLPQPQRLSDARYAGQVASRANCEERDKS